MSGDETVGQQSPPERPDGEPISVDETPPNPRDDDDRRETEQKHLSLEAGPRRTRNVELLVIEAELVADGHEPDNPATPTCVEVGEQFAERIEDTDLVPAWTRPWEDDDE